MSAHTAAIIILSVYLTAVLLVGVFVGRRARSSDDWKFGTGGLSVFGIIAMILGVRLGATSSVGLVENVYNAGLVAFSFILGQVVGAAVQSFTLAPILYRTGLKTLNSFTLHRFGKRPVAVALFLDLVIGIAINGIQLLGLGLIVQTLTGLDLHWGIVIGSVLGWAYLTLGGLSATAATNLIHLTVCFTGVFFGLFIVLGKMPILQAFDTLPESHLNPVTPFMTVVRWMIVGFAICMISNVYNNPLLTARSERQAITACVGHALIYGVFGLVVTLFGVYAYSYFAPIYEQATGQALAGANAFGVIASFIGNPDVGGSTFGLIVGTTMMAGVVGAIISTMAPLAWNIAMLLTHDVYKRFISPEASSQAELLCARIISTIYWLVPGLIALLVSSDLLGALLFLLELPSGGVFASFLVLYWDRVNEQAAFYTLCASVITGCAFKVITMIDPAFFVEMGPWYGTSMGWIFTVSAIVFLPFVLFGKPPRGDQVELVRRARQGLSPRVHDKPAEAPAP